MPISENIENGSLSSFVPLVTFASFVQRCLPGLIAFSFKLLHSMCLHDFTASELGLMATGMGSVHFESYHANQVLVVVLPKKKMLLLLPFAGSDVSCGALFRIARENFFLTDNIDFLVHDEILWNGGLRRLVVGDPRFVLDDPNGEPNEKFPCPVPFVAAAPDDDDDAVDVL